MQFCFISNVSNDLFQANKSGKFPGNKLKLAKHVIYVIFDFVV